MDADPNKIKTPLDKSNDPRPMMMKIIENTQPARIMKRESNKLRLKKKTNIKNMTAVEQPRTILPISSIGRRALPMAYNPAIAKLISQIKAISHIQLIKKSKDKLKTTGLMLRIGSQ